MMKNSGKGGVDVDLIMPASNQANRCILRG